MTAWPIYALAAVAEIAGCYGVWAWLRLGRTAWWLLAAIPCLLLFAWLLTRVYTDAAGRAYAAYGGIYVLSALAWLRLVDGVRPDRWDLAGVTLCLCGSALILFGPHRT